MMLETLARIETMIIQSRKAAKRTQILKTLQKVLISVFVVVLSILLKLIIE